MSHHDRDGRAPEPHGEEPAFEPADVELAWEAFRQVAEAEILPALLARYLAEFGHQADDDQHEEV